MKKYWPIAVIFVFSVLLVLPNLLTNKLILGADALFHYNRFYETAMQIKNGQFSYFISIYGFQQSGRIVNAVYGPIFAYFQGLLVLISRTWVKYQIVSNVIIYLVSALSMYKLLRYSKISQTFSLSLAIIFMTTYAIQYWPINQGFSSWGTAFLPLCLIPIVDMVSKKEFPILKIALSMVLLTQIHFLTAIMLSLIYLFFFIIYLWKNDDRRTVLVRLIKSAILYVILSANVLVSIAVIYLGNNIQSPFVNRAMSDKAINTGGSYWLLFPILLIPLAIVIMTVILKKWKKLTSFTKQVFILCLLFLILASSIIPWTWLVSINFPFVSLIQFPFRFFVPVTVLFFLLVGLILEQCQKKVRIYSLLTIMTIVCVLQTMTNTTQLLNQWENQTFTSLHAFIKTSPDVARQAFFSNDLESGLVDFEKSTPDYLPVWKQNSLNKYKRYEQDILNNQDGFTKTVSNGKLVIEWQSTTEELKTLPVILYKNTVMSFNNPAIQTQTISDIGTPTVQQVIGKNQVIISYQPPFYFYIAILASFFGWIMVIQQIIFKKLKKKSSNQ